MKNKLIIIKAIVALLTALVSACSISPTLEAPPIPNVSLAWATHRTESGCQVSMMEVLSKSPLPEQKKLIWSGACFEGRAEGWGNLEVNSTHFTSNSTGYFHKGRPLGYSIFSFGVPIPMWHYQTDDVEIGATRGLGLTISDIDMDAPAVVLPTAVAWKAPVDSYFFAGQMHTPTSSVVLTGSYCSWFKVKRLKCKSVSEKIFAIIEIPRGSSWISEEGFFTGKITLCPNPRSPSGCEETIERVIAPYRQEILDFIKRTKPSVDEQLAAMRQKLAAAARGQPNASTAPTR